MLGTLADCYLDGGRFVGRLFRFLVVLNDGLDGVTQELADDVLEVAEDVREGSFQVAVDFYLGDGGDGAVGALGYLAYCMTAALDDFFGDAFEEDFAYEFGFGEFGAGGEPRGVEGVC